MYRKTVIACTIVIVLITAFVACSFRGNTIKVSSNDYNGLKQLKSADFDRENSLSWELPENPYSTYSCYVTVVNNGLMISNHTPDNKSGVMQMNNGYFVGVNLGTFDGWVSYYPYYGSYPESGEPILIAHENFCGFIQIDKSNGYVITYVIDSNNEITGKLCYLSYTDNAWAFSTVTTFSGMPLTSLYVESEQNIYLVTTKSILSYSTESKSISVLKESSVLEYIDVNSVVRLNSNFYCGSPMGIYEYNTQTEEENWYPMDYEEYLRK